MVELHLFLVLQIHLLAQQILLLEVVALEQIIILLQTDLQVKLVEPQHQ
jgi:hypothetical protein